MSALLSKIIFYLFITIGIRIPFVCRLFIVFLAVVCVPLLVLSIIHRITEKVQGEELYDRLVKDYETMNHWLYLSSVVSGTIVIYGSEKLWTGFWVVVSGWLMGTIPALIARSKGRNFCNWLCYGMMIFIVSFIHSLFLRHSEESLVKKGISKKCLQCAEIIKAEAQVCRYCGQAQQALQQQKPSINT